jgi:hypothetical protein
VLGRPEHGDLPDVIHHADAGEALLLGLGGDPGQVVGQSARTGRKGEVRDVQTDLHCCLLRARAGGLHLERSALAGPPPATHEVFIRVVFRHPKGERDAPAGGPYRPPGDRSD